MTFPEEVLPPMSRRKSSLESYQTGPVDDPEAVGLISLGKADSEFQEKRERILTWT